MIMFGLLHINITKKENNNQNQHEKINIREENMADKFIIRMKCFT